MIETNRYLLSAFEHKILIAIGEAGAASVKEVHSQMGKVQFIDVMRDIHKLHKMGYLLQSHIKYEAFYRVKPRILAKLRKQFHDSNA